LQPLAPLAPTLCGRVDSLELLPDAPDVAEPSAHLGLRLIARESFVHQLLQTLLNVEPELVAHLAAHAPLVRW
jgi:hypothetical protein